MKIALILVVLLVLISAETVGGTVTANVKEVTHQDTTKKTEEKVIHKITPYVCSFDRTMNKR